MVKRTFLLFVLIFCSTQIAIAGINVSSKRDQVLKRRVVKLVNDAAKLVKEVGRVKAVCMFNAQNQRTQKGAPYLFAFVCNDGKNDSIVLANKNFDFVFKNFYDNPNHIMFRRELKKNPNGVWVHYWVKNADTGKVEEKYSYLVMLPKYKICIGSGYFVSS